MSGFRRTVVCVLTSAFVGAAGSACTPQEASDCASFLDCDGDGVVDFNDNCPGDHNPGQEDTDEKGTGEKNPDGIGDVCDNCPKVFNRNPDFTQDDTDGDGVGDACDSCPDAFNPRRCADGLVGEPCTRDDDCDSADGAGDGACGSPRDDDNDGVGNACDNCIVDANPRRCREGLIGEPCTRDEECDSEEDAGDGVCAASQADADEDGLGDACDPCPDDPSPDCGP